DDAHPDVRTLPHDLHPVVPFVEVDPYFLRLPRLEDTVEARRVRRIRSGAEHHLHTAIRVAPNVQCVTVLGAVHLRRLAEEEEEVTSHLAQRVSTDAQNRGELVAEQLRVAPRHALHRLLDHLIREHPLKLDGRGVPDLVRQVTEEALGDGKGIVDHRQQVRVLRLELDHADDTQSTDQLEQGAIVVDEGVVAVLRNRDPPTEIPTVVACPPPLSVVSIPVTHEHIHQASLQEGAGV